MCRLIVRSIVWLIDRLIDRLLLFEIGTKVRTEIPMKKYRENKQVLWNTKQCTIVSILDEMQMKSNATERKNFDPSYLGHESRCWRANSSCIGSCSLSSWSTNKLPRNYFQVLDEWSLHWEDNFTQTHNTCLTVIAKTADCADGTVHGGRTAVHVSVHDNSRQFSILIESHVVLYVIRIAFPDQFGIVP